MLVCMFTGVFLVKLVKKNMAKYGAKTRSYQVNGGQRPSMHALLMLGPRGSVDPGFVEDPAGPVAEALLIGDSMG